ncbi:MAG: hypothetical protein RLY49_439 [Candidatus Parcubacteria bacterium]|jgi:hypothetical protein
MPFLKPKNTFTYSLHISLKSSSIDFQLIKVLPNNKREVLFVERNILFLQNSQDPKLYTDTYIKELKAAFEKNHASIKQIIQNNPCTIVFILHTPWFTSRIDSLNFENEIVLNDDFIEQELKKIPADDKLYVLEKCITKIQTNGYTITHIENTRCSHVQIDVYSSFIAKDTYSMLKDILKQYFPESKTAHCKTSPMAIVENTTRFMIKEDNLVFVHVSGEITEVGIIQDDALVQFATFPIGIHDFLRALQTNIKSYEYDLLYQKEVLIKSPQSQVQLDTVIQSWGNSVIQTLQYFGTHVPHKFLLLSNPKVASFFTEILSKTLQNNAQMNLKNHRIINFDISLLKDIITYKTPTGEIELDLTLEALI